MCMSKRLHELFNIDMQLMNIIHFEQLKAVINKPTQQNLLVNNILQANNIFPKVVNYILGNCNEHNIG